MKKKINTLSLFKKHTIGKIVSLMFPIPEKFKSKNQNFFQKNFAVGQKKKNFADDQNSSFRGNLISRMTP